MSIKIWSELKNLLFLKLPLFLVNFSYRLISIRILALGSLPMEVEISPFCFIVARGCLNLVN